MLGEECLSMFTLIVAKTWRFMISFLGDNLEDVATRDFVAER